jgi:hypothetical protein
LFLGDINKTLQQKLALKKKPFQMMKRLFISKIKI